MADAEKVEGELDLFGFIDPLDRDARGMAENAWRKQIAEARLSGEAVAGASSAPPGERISFSINDLATPTLIFAICPRPGHSTSQNFWQALKSFITQSWRDRAAARRRFRLHPRAIMKSGAKEGRDSS